MKKHAFFTAGLLLVLAVAVVPSAAADECDAFRERPPETVCEGLEFTVNTLDRAVAFTGCVLGYDPIVHGLGYLVGCTSHL